MIERFKVGDRVQINPERAGAYIKVWEARIKRGLFGTVRKVNSGALQNRYNIDFDMPKRAKYILDWRWSNVDERELLSAQQQEEAA